jgi:hypothetical protein
MQKCEHLLAQFKITTLHRIAYMCAKLEESVLPAEEQGIPENHTTKKISSADAVPSEKNNT